MNQVVGIHLKFNSKSPLKNGGKGRRSFPIGLEGKFSEVMLNFGRVVIVFFFVGVFSGPLTVEGLRGGFF